MADRYLLDENDNPVPEPDLNKWAKSFQTGKWIVGKTTIGGSKISTVFLGLNHNFDDGPPLLFETMVFGGALDGEQEQYETREQAEKGHEATVLRVEEASRQQAERKGLSL